jgi:hypothetical protein
MNERTKLRGKLTYANVVATLALFIAVGGAGAFAATQLPKNSVGTKQIKKNAVNSSKVANGSLLPSDLKGQKFPQGPKGDPGPQGEPGATKVVMRLGPITTTPFSPGSDLYGSRANCQPGERATGGGYLDLSASSGTGDNAIQINRPNSDGSGLGTLQDEEGRSPIGWTIQLRDVAGNGASIQAWVICVSP